MIENKNQSSKLKKYEKPKLRVIKLAAEEVLSTGCKVNEATVGTITLCSNSAIPGTCGTLGTS